MLRARQHKSHVRSWDERQMASVKTYVGVRCSDASFFSFLFYNVAMKRQALDLDPQREDCIPMMREPFDKRVSPWERCIFCVLPVANLDYFISLE